jgi:MFS family permease
MKDDNVSMTPVSENVPKKGRAGVAMMFALGLIAVFASAIILTILVTGGLGASMFFWPMTILGAVVIGCLLAAAALPALKDPSGH